MMAALRVVFPFLRGTSTQASRYQRTVLPSASSITHPKIGART